MSTENLKPTEISKLMLQELEDLGHEGDFSILKDSIAQMYECSQSHHELDHKTTRLELFISFRLLYNFFSKMEAYNDDGTINVNLLP